jgi:hypothetical protein
VPDGVDLTQSEFEVVSIIKHVHEIRVKRMDVLQFGKFRDDRRQLVVIILLRVFHLRKKEEEEEEEENM